jgi:sulfane dehydrogenase subunit SoxC
MDGGRMWDEAQLQEPVLPKCHTRFRFGWRWKGEDVLLQSRCADETGYVQPTRAALVAARGVHSSYHYNAIQTWKIARDGLVTNVHL